MEMMLGAKQSLSELAAGLQSWGAHIVVLKLGDQGLYARWDGCELLAPCFEVNVAGTTGSGDCTIAGFLAAWLRGLSPEQVMTTAVAVGACCCEKPDATSGVPGWETVQQRISLNWKRRPVSLPMTDWKWDETHTIWLKKQ